MAFTPFSVQVALLHSSSPGNQAYGQSSGGGHDCVVNDPAMAQYAACKNPLVSDKNCRVTNGSSVLDANRMDCEVMFTSIPAKTASKKWIVIHAGGCDTDTEVSGDYFSKDGKYNYFSLRPCAGMAESKCLAAYNGDICSALHMT